VATVNSPGSSLAAVLVAATLSGSACGSSSRTETLTGPSPTKCTVQATADGPSFPAAGGSGSIRIGTTRDCQWAVKTDASWVTVAQPSEGQGEGSVRFSVTANDDPASRTAGITINDQRVDISQAGKPCELTVSSNHESVGSGGGDLSVNVRASASTCSWTASSGVSWISITSGRDGRGNGTVTFHADAVTGPPRTGNVTIAGQNVQVDQGTGCNFAIDADTFNLDPSGGDRQVSVTAPAGCGWTAQSQVSWITITAGGSGSGPGAVGFRVAASSGPGRSGTLIVAGRTVTVAQSLGCSFTVSSTSVNVAAQAASATIQVDAGPGCAWNAQSQTPWITITSGATGSGPGAVAFSVTASDGPARSGTLIVAGRTITVTQSVGCAYSISATAVNVTAQAATTTIQVDAGAGCAWTAASAVPWISIASGATGSGHGAVQIATVGNDGPARAGAITIAGQSVSVTQASGCTYSVAPASQSIGGNGGAITAAVTTGAGCPWTASSGVDWMTAAPSSGVGSGPATFTVTPNASAPRTGGATIAGRPFTVSQESLCKWAFAPPSHELPSAGGSGNVLVFVTGACSWTAVPNVPWIQITAGGSATGGALLQFLVPANPGAARTGLIAIGGENYVVHQSGIGDSADSVAFFFGR
jgi:hypothetical protein